jgi:flagellar hook-associated protein 1
MSIISTAMSGLNAAQIAIEVSGKNIANVSTQGYHRSVVTHSSSEYGVVSTIERMVSNYNNQSLWLASSSAGYFSVYSANLSQLENTFSADQMSLTSALDSFDEALSSALTAPSSLSQREQVLLAAEHFTNTANSLSNYLNTMESQLRGEQEQVVSQVNSLAAEVARLGSKIESLEAVGGDVSSLKDQRDHAVTRLSGYVDISVTSDSRGRYDISLNNGQPLVTGASSAELFVDSSGDLKLRHGVSEFDVSGDVGGQLGGQIGFQAQAIEQSREELDVMVRSYADAFNSQLGNGSDLNGDAGQQLFIYNPTAPAGTIGIAPGFAPEELAFAGSGGGVGDNSNLQQLTQLGEGAAEDYNTLLATLAVSSQNYKLEAASSEYLVIEANNKIEALSGVNLEEEAAKLIEFQQNYQANAQVISVATQLFDSLLQTL